MKPPSAGQDVDHRATYGPILLDTGTAHLALGVRPERIRQWVKRGKLQVVGRSGRRNLFAAADIERLLDTD